MKTKVECPRCQQHIEAEGQLKGQPIICPSCQTGFVPERASLVEEPDPMPVTHEIARMKAHQAEVGAQAHVLQQLASISAFAVFRGFGLLVMVGVGIAAVVAAIFLLNENQIANAVILLAGACFAEILLFSATQVLTAIADTLAAMLREQRRGK